MADYAFGSNPPYELYDDYSAERLMKMLTVFEQDIEIVMRPHREAGEPGRITFKPVAA